MQSAANVSDPINQPCRADFALRVRTKLVNLELHLFTRFLPLLMLYHV